MPDNWRALIANTGDDGMTKIDQNYQDARALLHRELVEVFAFTDECVERLLQVYPEMVNDFLADRKAVLGGG